MYERRSHPLLPKEKYYRRVLRNFGWSAAIVGFSLLVGILGYHLTENLNWLDSLLNASMILTGMGPVDVMKTTSGKLFASFYALFSGVAFLTIMAVVMAPILHRFMHKFHMEEK